MYRVGPFFLNGLKQIIAEGKSSRSDIKQWCGIRNLIRYQEWEVLYLRNRNRLIDKENTLVAAKEGRGGRGVDCKFGVGRCKLLHSEWIKQQDHRAQRWFRC